MRMDFSIIKHPLERLQEWHCSWPRRTLWEERAKENCLVGRRFFLFQI